MHSCPECADSLEDLSDEIEKVKVKSSTQCIILWMIQKKKMFAFGSSVLYVNHLYINIEA